MVCRPSRIKTIETASITEAICNPENILPNEMDVYSLGNSNRGMTQNLGDLEEGNILPHELGRKVMSASMGTKPGDTSLFGKPETQIIYGTLTCTMNKKWKLTRSSLELVDIQDVTADLIQRNHPDLVTFT